MGSLADCAGRKLFPGTDGKSITGLVTPDRVLLLKTAKVYVRQGMEKSKAEMQAVDAMIGLRKGEIKKFTKAVVDAYTADNPSFLTTQTKAELDAKPTAQEKKAAKKAEEKRFAELQRDQPLQLQAEDRRVEAAEVRNKDAQKPMFSRPLKTIEIGNGESLNSIWDFKSDEGNFSTYDTAKNVDGIRGRNAMFVVHKDSDGYIVRNAILPSDKLRQGIATKFYEAINRESLDRTGRPLRSTQPRVLSSGEKVHELSSDAVALWDSFVKRGLAQKLGDKDYAFNSGAAMFSRAATADPRDLIVTHNLSIDNLYHVGKLGGIPVPSLAITKAKSSLENFGEITLIGKPQMADPKGYAKPQVFGADIYSPRYPTVEYTFKDSAIKKLESTLKDGLAATNSNLDYDALGRRGPEGLRDIAAVRYEFLKSKAIEPTIIREEKIPDAQMALLRKAGLLEYTLKPIDRYDLRGDEAFQRKAWQYTQQQYDDSGAGDLKSAFEKTDARTRAYNADDVIRSLEKVNKPQEIVGYLTAQALSEQINKANLQEEYADYAQSLFDGMSAGERMFQGFTDSGNRRYKAHTLENVVAILKKDLRGGEGFNYGVGSLRAQYTPQFRTVKQIKENAGRLVSSDDFETVKAEVDGELQTLAEDLGSYYKSDSTRFGFLDTVIGTLEDAGKMGVTRALKENQFENVPDDLVTDIRGYLEKLRNLPAEYFEAKIKRDVSLSEFAAAVIPKLTPKRARDILEKAGVQIFEYDRGSESSRREAVAKAAEAKDAMFSRNSGTISPNDFKADETNRVFTDRLQRVLVGERFTITPTALPEHYSDKQVVSNERGGTAGSFRLAERVAKLFGHEVVWMRADGNFPINGVMHAAIKGKIFIDVRATDPVYAVMGHELSHHIEFDAPKVYAKLLKAIARVAQNHEQYRRSRGMEAGSSIDAINKEITGDLLGDAFGDPQFWSDVAKYSKDSFRSIADKIMGWLNDTIAKLTGFSSERYVNDLKVARSALAQAVAEYAMIKKGATQSDANSLYAKAYSDAGDAKLSRLDQTVFDTANREELGLSGKFNPADYRKSVTDWAQSKWGDKVAPDGSKVWENFTQWFGDSKVVDAEGRPLVVYHGTKNDFTVFDISRGGEGTGSAAGRSGFMFSSKAKVASSYPMRLRFNEGSEIGQITGANIKSVYLKLSNPYVMARGKGQSTTLTESDKNAAIKEAQDGGHDGVIFRDFNDSPMSAAGKSDIFLVFNPTQIKSATGNNGNFDGTNPDIRYSRPNDETFTSPAPSKMDNILYKLQDKQIDLKRVTQAIRDFAGNLSETWDAYLKETLFHGRSAKRVKSFAIDELKPLTTEMQMRGVTMLDFQTYLHNRHAEERNRQVAKINPKQPDGGSGIDTKDARSYLRNLTDEQKTKYEALAKRIDAISAGTRQTLQDYGLMSNAEMAKWKGAYKHYVPLMKDTEITGTGEGFSIRGPESQRALGGGAIDSNIIANLAAQRERAIVRGEKGRVGLAMYGLAKLNPNPDFWTTDTPPIVRRLVKLSDKTDRSTIPLGMDIPEAATEVVVEGPDPQFLSRDNVIVVKYYNPATDTVTEKAIIFNEDNPRAMRMAQSLKNLDMDQLGEIMGTIAKATRFLAAVNTQYNPIFGLVNLIRDIQGAAFNLSSTEIADKRVDVVKQIIPALIGVYLTERGSRKGRAPTGKWAELYEEFQNVGGQTGYRDLFTSSTDRAESLQSEIDQITEGKVKQAGRAMFDWLSDYNQAMENSTRLAAYKVAKESGLSKEKAASIAKDITVNFNRKGQITQQAGALYAFFNASVQGTERLARTLNSPAGKKIISGGLILGVLQAFALAGFDEDEPPQFERERNLIIPLGGKQYFKIPMPLGLHVIPNIGRIFTEMGLHGKPMERMVQLLSVTVDAFNPVGSVGLSAQTFAPTVADPFVALGENRDWTGKPISREDFSSLNPTPGHARTKDTATWHSKVISEALNWSTGGTEFTKGKISPTADQLDYLIGQVTGGVGREASKIQQTIAAGISGEELAPYKIPIVGRFYGSTESQASKAALFYRNLKQLNAHEAEIEGRNKAGQDASDYIRDNPDSDMYEAANKMELVIRKMTKQKRDMVKNNEPKADVKELESAIAETMHEFNVAVREQRSGSQPSR